MQSLRLVGSGGDWKSLYGALYLKGLLSAHLGGPVFASSI
jgi:hypothetical protein